MWYVCVPMQDGEGKEQSMGCGLVMMATGRAPKSMNLGLQQLGVALGPNGAVMVRLSEEWNKTEINGTA